MLVLVNITISSNTQGRYEYTRQHVTCNIPPPFIAEWTDQPSPITVNPFNSPSGPVVSISSDPLEFSLFFDSNVVDLIAMETNRYASQCRGDDDICETNAEEI